MTRAAHRLAWCLCTLLFALCAWASDGVITLEVYPPVTVADGRSTLTVTASVRDSSGNLVPDGTQVVFDTTLGTFREKVLSTRNGTVRAILVAGSVAGFSKVRASAVRLNAAAETDVEFVRDRSMLSSVKDFIEVVGQDTLWYSVTDRIIEATGAQKTAHLKYRDIEIFAEDMQLQVQQYSVVARKARLKIGTFEHEFDELFFILNRRKGFGTATIQIPVPGTEGETRAFFGLVEVGNGAIIYPPQSRPDVRQLRFANISESVSKVSAKKAVAYPRSEVQFHKADVRLADQRLMQLPLFRVNIHDSSPVITEQWVNVSNNSLALNYPYYLSLKPGETSLFRVRYGASYGTGVGASQGTYLDYEMTWNRGANFDGGLSVKGIGRDDWGLGIRQTWSSDDTTSLAAQIDFPAHKSMYATANLSRQFPGFSANLNGSYGQNLSGSRFQSDSVLFIAEKDPIKFGKLPVRMFLGVTANQTRFSTAAESRTQQAYGASMRLVTNQLSLGSGATVNAQYTLQQLSGQNTKSGLSQFASLNVGINPFPGAFISTSYQFTDDAFTSQFLGKHQLIADASYRNGLFSVSTFLTKSLDVDRLNASARMRYRLGDLWRLSYGYYLDQFGADSFTDQSMILSYRLGYRELGISYSQRKKRFGLEILGTSID